MDGWARMRRALSAFLLVALVAATAAACGSDDDAESGSGPSIVVTTPMLGSLVSDLVGDRARVTVLIPNGTDPHDYQPSAKDIGRLENADLVVANGLDLEEGLEDPLGGVPVERLFQASDVVSTLRPAEEHEDDHAEGEEEEHHHHGAFDPHLWMDPLTMRDVVAGLAPELKERTGLDVADRAADLEQRLTALDGEVRDILAPIPAARRTLVTGHESMGYFAARYDFRIAGSVIASLSSEAQVSAANIARLKRQIERERVPAIFTELGTPADVVRTLGDETGAEVVEIGTHSLPADGSYFTFMRDVATAIAGGLTAARS
ncbi:MAG: metal ABC transporter substrate-binding protein [Thermoleophilia bacterium]